MERASFPQAADVSALDSLSRNVQPDDEVSTPTMPTIPTFSPNLHGPTRVLALAGCLAVAGLLAPSRSLDAVTYVAFGDSITEGTGDDENREEKGYPPRLRDLLQPIDSDVVVRNEGVGGERTPEGLERIDSVLAAGGDVLLLMEGSNDISRSISRETTLFNLRQMAQRAERQGFDVIHATMIPRIPTANRDSDNILNQRLIEELRAEAAASGRDVADNFEVFGSLPNVFENYYWDQPTDGVGHPNAAGFDVMAELFFDVIQGIDSVPPVTGIMEPWNGQEEVDPDTPIAVEVYDFGAGLDVSFTTLFVDGSPVNATIDELPRGIRLRFRSPTPLSGRIDLRLQSRDFASPPNTVDREIGSFLIVGGEVLVGDFDDDGFVDGRDLVRLGLAFGSSQGSERWDGPVDLDGNGVIDGEDLARFAANFGESL